MTKDDGREQEVGDKNNKEETDKGKLEESRVAHTASLSD